MDALLYVVKTGCQRRQLPTNFPPWLSVHQQFRACRDDGTWERVIKTVREQGRKAGGRNATPSVAIIDSQSSKTALKRDCAVTRSRGASSAVDTQGNLLAARCIRRPFRIA